MHIPNLIEGGKLTIPFYLYFLSWSVIGHFPPCYDCFSSGLHELSKNGRMKLFVKNVMIPNKIVYKPRWEGVCFLPVSNISSTSATPW
jgi:hypothetical protein